jgi:hypothetical protein
VTRALGEWPRWLRATAASLTLFVLVGIGQVLPVFHFALVAHSVCAEHGELVHEAAPRAQGPQSETPDGPALVAGGDVGHQHEHCGVLALARALAIPAAARPEPPPPTSWAELQVAGAERSAHVGIALLSYAPKLAPPLA